MEQLIEAFGIDLKGITVQIINFAILVALLSYFLYRPILNLLDEREAKITAGIKDAEAAAESKAKAEDERLEVLKAAHHDAEEINTRARSSAEEKSAEIVKAAEEKAASVIRAAEGKGEDIKNQARKDSEAEIASLAVLAAEKVLREKAS